MGHHILAIKTHIVVLGGPREAKMLILKVLGLVPECARREDEASYKCITQMIYIPDMALNGENENVIILYPAGAKQQWRGTG